MRLDIQIPMTSIAEAYRRLIEECHTSRDRYSESYLCVFSMGVGRKYNGKLLVVGRATNGWGNGFSKDDLEDCRHLSDTIIPIIGSENLDWVTQQWGATDKYNTRKSQFWRVSRMLARRIASNSEDCIDHICWSNLYKVAPDGGNPSSRLMTVQFERCAEVLRSEIESSKAENVVFLTGYGWARPFLDRLNVTNQKSADSNFVEFASSTEGVNYVVGQHPQGKPEQPHCDEIVNALNYLAVNARTVT